MTPRDAYQAGRQARADGFLWSDNKHTDWTLAVAWAAGWHHVELADCVTPCGVLELQTAEIAGEIWE